MARTTQVVTPENIPLTLELAGISSRFGAFLFDTLLQGSAIFVLFLLIILIGGIAGSSSTFSNLLIALMIAVSSLILVGYPILFETIWNGQTPGKRIFRLRVIRDGGYPASFFAIATRNLMRIADFLPTSYTVGALAIFFSPQYRRLGDMVAGTLVVKEKQSDFRGFAAPTKPGQETNAHLPEGVLNPYDAMTPEELSLLRRFAVRRWQMTSDDSERVAYRLVAPLVPRLGITFAPGAPPRYADLASVLAVAADQRETELTEAGR